MGFLIGLLVLATAYGISSVTRAVQKGKETVLDTTSPNVQQWSQYVRPLAQQNGVDPGVAEAWLAIESGGNICAVGEKTAVGPDGSPREIGLFQLYNPDDFAHLKAKAADLRAYCVKPLPGQPDPQRLSRQPTAQEIAHHIALGIQKIHQCMSTASHYLTDAGIGWGADTSDFWKAVKLVHALPVIVSTGFSAVAKKLGRAPLTWSEFRTTYEGIQPRAKFNPNVAHQDGYWRALENAEQTGNHFEGASVA